MVEDFAPFGVEKFLDPFRYLQKGTEVILNARKTGLGEIPLRLDLSYIFFSGDSNSIPEDPVVFVPRSSVWKWYQSIAIGIDELGLVAQVGRYEANGKMRCLGYYNHNQRYGISTTHPEAIILNIGRIIGESIEWIEYRNDDGVIKSVPLVNFIGDKMFTTISITEMRTLASKLRLPLEEIVQIQSIMRMQKC